MQRVYIKCVNRTGTNSTRFTKQRMKKYEARLKLYIREHPHTNTTSQLKTVNGANPDALNKSNHVTRTLLLIQPGHSRLNQYYREWDAQKNCSN